MKTLGAIAALSLAVTPFALGQRSVTTEAEALREGDIVSFVAPAPGSAALAGVAHDENFGTVALRALDPDEKSATRWRVHEPAPGTFAFQCLAFADAPAWLNGGTISGKVGLALSPTGVSGTAWAIYREPGGHTLKCLGKAKGVRWLMADSAAKEVALVDDTATQPTVWNVRVWHRARAASQPRTSGAAR